MFLTSIKQKITNALSALTNPVAADLDPGVLKLAELNAASPVRNRSGSAKRINKTKNRAKAKAAKAARKASRK